MFEFLIDFALGFGRLLLNFIPGGSVAQDALSVEFVMILGKGVSVLGLSKFLLYIGTIFAWLTTHFVVGVVMFVIGFIPVVNMGD
jgi:hypothetical protein